MDYLLTEYMVVDRTHYHPETDTWQRLLNFMDADRETIKGLDSKNENRVSTILSKGAAYLKEEEEP